METALRRRRRGFVLIATALCAVVLMGALGLALDLGRMYAVRGEVQSFADAAAVRAAIRLDGTRQGLQEAERQAMTAEGRYHFGSERLPPPVVRFSAQASGPWLDAQHAMLESRFVEISAAAQVGAYFMRAVNGREAGLVAARSVAGQVEKSRFAEGLFPYSPQVLVQPPGRALEAGMDYPLGPPQGLCGVEQTGVGPSPPPAAPREFAAGPTADAIESDFMPLPIAAGTPWTPPPPAGDRQRASLRNRLLQDTDPDSSTYAAYVAGNRGNGRRLLACPVNDGETITGFGAFFLKRVTEQPPGGADAWCAEYAGSWVQGSRRKGAAPSGAYVVRLVD